MRQTMRYLVCLLAATCFLAGAAGAAAETWTLELKRLEGSSTNPAENLYQPQSPQHFYMMKGRTGDPQSAAFKKIVTKEPNYKSADPFRGIVKLGSREFAFVIDLSVPESKEKATNEKDETKGAKADAATAKKKPKANKPPQTSPAVAQLYFDFNHNGDLSDDKVIVGQGQASGDGSNSSFVNVSFPRIDVAIDVNGAPVQSSFLVKANSQMSSNFGYMSVQFGAAAYRTAEITLDGKKHRVALIDSNSNGRFDDAMGIRKESRESKGPLYPELGDVLLIDAEQSAGRASGENESMSDPLGLGYRRYVSKLILIDGRYYDIKITPAGDKLTLEPSSLALGSITIPIDGLSAILYSGDSFLGIHGDKGAAIPMPEGQWKLVVYTIVKAEAKPDPSAKIATEKDAKQQPPRIAGLRVSMAAAMGRADGKPVKVVKGETVSLPFGPPYKPVVTASNAGQPKGAGQLALEMALVGSGGEVCAYLMCNGDRPAKPKFTITDPQGKVVQKGSFEYG
jgi:hypothetical protein